MSKEDKEEVEGSSTAEEPKVWYLAIVLCSYEEERIKEFLEFLPDKYSVDKRPGRSFSFEIINHTIKNIPGRILFYLNGYEGPREYVRMIPAFLSASQSCICFYNEKELESVNLIVDLIQDLTRKKAGKTHNDYYLSKDLKFVFIESKDGVDQNRHEVEEKIASVKGKLREDGFEVIAKEDKQAEQNYSMKILEEIIQSIGPDVITAKLYPEEEEKEEE